MKKSMLYLIFAILFFCSDQKTGPKIQSVVGNEFAHSHLLSIRFDDIEAGQERFVLEESAGHRHELYISPENRALLLMRLPIQVQSTQQDGHSHPVSIYVADE